MTRRYVAQTGFAELGTGIALLAVLLYRPQWISVAVVAYAKVWESTVAPWLVQLLLRG
jgi:hypothetical protein